MYNNRYRPADVAVHFRTYEIRCLQKCLVLGSSFIRDISKLFPMMYWKKYFYGDNRRYIKMVNY